MKWKLLLTLLIGVLFLLAAKPVEAGNPTNSSWINMDDVVLYMKMDNSTQDESGYANHGTQNGDGDCSTDINGKLNTSCRFNAGGLSVTDVPNIRFDSGTNDFTLAAWVNWTKSSASGYVFDKRDGNDDGYRMLILGAASNIVFCSVDAIDATWNIDAWAGYRHIACVFDRDGNIAIFIDGKNVDDDTAIGGEAMATTVALNLGDDSQGATNNLEGDIDEALIWNRTLTDTEVNTLYNCNKNPSNATACNYTAPVATDSGLIDLLFRNTTSSLYKTIYSSGENFFTYVNWTNSTGSPINNTDGQCNISVVGGLVEETIKSDNMTLCNNVLCDNQTYKNQVTFHTAENGFEDLVHFKACYESVDGGDIQVNITCQAGNIQETVPSTSVASCSNGELPLIFVNNSICALNKTINITLEVDDAYANRIRIFDFEIDKEYTTHLNHFKDGDVIFNTSLNLWQSTHTHEFYKGGSKEIFANCSANNTDLSNHTSENITINNRNVTIFIESVNNTGGSFALVNGSLLSNYTGTGANNLWQWIISIVDDDIDTINYTFYNSTGSVIQSNQSNTAINLQTPISIFKLDDLHNLTVWANDTSGATTQESIRFNITALISDSNVTNISLSDGECTIGTEFNLTGYFECVGGMNCSGSYYYTLPTGCSVTAGALTDTYSISNVSNFTSQITASCGFAGVNQFVFNVTNYDGVVETANFNASCGAGGLTDDDRSCLYTGRFINGTSCAAGGGERDMIMGITLIYLAITAGLVAGAFMAKTIWLKTGLALASSIMVMTLLRLSSWFAHITNPAETELINTLDHYYMFGVWGFRLAMIAGVFVTLIVVMNIFKNVGKRDKKGEWEKWGSE